MSGQAQHQNISEQNVSQHDVQRFEQALVNPQIVQTPSEADSAAASAVKGAIAVFENMEAKNDAIISKLSSSGTEITPTSVLEFNVALEQRSIDYSFAKQLINAPSQWIKELTSMQ
jgi:hypothetical protein